MEVFLVNLPDELTEKTLTPHLSRAAQQFGFRDWICWKPVQKNYGNIIFLNAREGETFLSYFGFGGHARLVILGQEVKCKRSKNPLDPFRIKSLHKTIEDRREEERLPSLPPDQKLKFFAKSLSCGVYDYSRGQSIYSPQVEWADARGEAIVGIRALIINYSSQTWRRKVEIPYRIIEVMVVSKADATITLTLWEAPRFFQEDDPSISDMMAMLSMKNKPRNPKRRLIELPGGSSTHYRVLGQSLVYRINASRQGFAEMIKSLQKQRSNVLRIIHHDDAPLPLGGVTLESGLKEFDKLIQRFAQSNRIPFDVLFQMEALVRNGYLLPWTAQDVLIKIKDASENSNRLDTKSFPISAAAIRKVSADMPFPGPEVDATNFEAEEVWNWIQENEREIQQGFDKGLITEKGRQSLTLVHKCNVTPTGMTLKGPDPEVKNRILRRFPDNTNYFMRVQFSDEDGTDLQFNSNVSNDDIYNRFKSVFKTGISVGGRVYGFLGFSHSSLRGHSAWFAAPFIYQGKLQSYFTIISFLGDFKAIQCPARHAARIGQAFSETPFSIPLAANGIGEFREEDVKSRDGTRVFSDGVARISSSVVEAIKANMPGRKSSATCFQIRWGGAKGMLALDTRLDGHHVMTMRPSMIKFPSTDTANLEICDTANRPIRLVLNRQLIKILEDMGVSADWFFSQQSNAIEGLRMITAHISNTVRFLRRKNIATRIRFPQLLRRLHELSLDYRTDRFLSSVVEATVLEELRVIKHKARIPIEKGVTLFGIMDETGFLQEGQIYVTFDKADYIEDNCLDLNYRRMIVTRSPALHPGDIQLATNVVPPYEHPLRHLRNCIIFSKRGERDLPSCLSGGDLDGDVYGIIWDEEAVAECQKVYQPADYPRVVPKSIDRDVTPQDITDFFIEFMRTDQLGLIAVKHMILADQRDKGTDDPDCKQLAEMHSTGVDYSKSGIPINMDLLKNIKFNWYRPDFLSPAPLASIKERGEIVFDAPTGPSAMKDDDDESGPNHQFYASEKINGQLYRAIDERKIWFDDVKVKISFNPASNIWTDLLEYIKMKCYDSLPLGTSGWAQAKKEAWQIRENYEWEICCATSAFSDHAAKTITELEVFTGSIFNKTGSQTRRQRDRSVGLHDKFNDILRQTEAQIHKGQWYDDDDDDYDGEHFYPTIDDSNDYDALTLSVACLQVGTMMDPSKKSSRRFDEELLSFKVVAASCAIREMDAMFSR